MEDSPVLTPSEKKCGLKRFHLGAIWLAIVAACTVFGYFRPGNQIEGSEFSVRAAVEVAALFGGFGIGIATCIAFGLEILNRIRRGQLARWRAIAVLAVSALASTVATPITILLARAVLPWDILSGERALGIAAVFGWMVLAGAVGFAFFGLLVFVAGRGGTTVSR